MEGTEVSVGMVETLQRAQARIPVSPVLLEAPPASVVKPMRGVSSGTTYSRPAPVTSLMSSLSEAHLQRAAIRGLLELQEMVEHRGRRSQEERGAAL